MFNLISIFLLNVLQNKGAARIHSTDDIISEMQKRQPQ